MFWFETPWSFVRSDDAGALLPLQSISVPSFWKHSKIPDKIQNTCGHYSLGSCAAMSKKLLYLDVLAENTRFSCAKTSWNLKKPSFSGGVFNLFCRVFPQVPPHRRPGAAPGRLGGASGCCAADVGRLCRCAGGAGRHRSHVRGTGGGWRWQCDLIDASWSVFFWMLKKKLKEFLWYMIYIIFSFVNWCSSHLFPFFPCMCTSLWQPTKRLPHEKTPWTSGKILPKQHTNKREISGLLLHNCS